MTNGKSVSYKEIVDIALSRHKWAAPYFDDDLGLNAITSLLRITKSKPELHKKIVWGKVTNGKTELPDDLYLIESIAKSTYDTIEKADCNANSLIAMRWNTDTFRRTYHKSDRDYRTESIYTYTVNNNYIFTNFSEGVIAIAYQAVPLDEDGYPLVPFNESWIQAASYQIAWYIAENMFMQDKITENKLYRIERDRDWYLSQAVVSSKMPNKDKREVIKNNAIRSIPQVNAHEDFFRNIQMPERRDYNGQYGK